ncbi:MAG: S8 family serine peptidase [Candidatus Heimdallarchaeota archaeon]
MRSGKLLSICLLSLFVFTIVTPIAITNADFTLVESESATIIQSKMYDANEDKIDDKLMADIIIDAKYYLDVSIVFDHQVTGVDLFKIGRLGAFCYDETWDMGRRVKAHISRDMLDELTEIPGVSMITSASIRNIFVFIEGTDISGFDVLVQNFDGVRILEALNVAMVPYYSGVENDIASLGHFDDIIDVTDARLEMHSVTESPVKEIDPQTSTTANIINATGMWTAGYNGNGIKVGIIDTGINSLHTDLAGRIGDAQSFVYMIYGYDHDDPSAEDVDGHGSHTSGIACGDGSSNAAAIGMAPSSTVYMARVLPSATLYSIAEGANWLVKTKGVDVVNLSFGSDGGDDPTVDIVEKTFTQLVRNYGVLVTNSAGNEGGMQQYTIGTPASCDDTIAVGNLDTSDGLPYTMAYSSSQGLTSLNTMKPDVLAPGTDILSLGPGSATAYATLSGTSMAAPHVCGAIALLIHACKANGIDYTPGVIKAALLQSATLVDPDMDFKIQGRGLINVGVAWNIIKQAEKEGIATPIIGAMNPLKIPHNFWDPMVQGQTAEIMVTCATPFKTGLSLEVTGDAAQFITVGDFNGEWTDIVKLTFLIPVDAILGDYTGLVTLKYNDTYVLDQIDIDLEIDESNGNRIMNNYRSTNRGDNHIFYGQHYDFCADIMINGYALSEQYEELNDTILANYEMIWFPDPYSIRFPKAYMGDFTIAKTFNDWTDDEITALDTFVANGGTVFMDFLGLHYDDAEAVYYGTNITTINRFTEDYGITVRDDIWENPNTIMVGTVGDNPLTKDVNYVDHYGCSLELSGDAVMVTEFAPGSSYATCAYTQTAGGGRVIILTTNFIMDTDGYANMYSGGATQNDVFSMNIVRWGAAKNRIERMNATQVGSDIVVKYNYLTGDDELFSGYATGPTGTTGIVWVEESTDVWKGTISGVESGDYYINVECGESGVDEYDYFMFTATGTGGIGLSTGIVVLISTLGLASWYVLSRRKKA